MYRSSVLALLFLIFATLSPCKAQQDDRVEGWKQWQLMTAPSATMDAKEWKEFDFGTIWGDTRLYSGYFGGGWYSELDSFSLDRIEKISPIEYIVEGMMSINDRENAFSGSFFVEDVRQLYELDYGIDARMVEGKVKNRGVVVARFYLDTDKQYDDHGMLQGVVFSRWYVDMAGELQYDDLGDFSEYYDNNQFVGTFIAYDRDQPLNCAWGQYRVPDVDRPEVISIEVLDITTEDAEMPQVLPYLICDDDDIAFMEEAEDESSYIKEIAILGGEATLEMDCRYIDFPCIGLHFSDRNARKGTGTYLEVKRDGDSYLVEVEYERRRFATIDAGIEAFLKDLFERFYEESDKKYGKKVWKAFVKEGGLRQFIDKAKEHIDDEFLDTPFNEIYG